MLEKLISEKSAVRKKVKNDNGEIQTITKTVPNEDFFLKKSSAQTPSHSSQPCGKHRPNCNVLISRIGRRIRQDDENPQ